VTRFRRLCVVGTVLLGTSGCSIVGFGGGPVADGVTVLAKASGWNPSLHTEDERYGSYFAVLEIAYDEQAARAAWEATVPSDLSERSGEPREAGRYGSLDDVDLDEQVLVVFSGGESGACPGWLGDVSVEDGEVHLEERRHMPGNGCTDDYNAYRMVLAVDRDKVPADDAVPTEDVLVDGRALAGLVTAFPAG
jgi:hypothetical protein